MLFFNANFICYYFYPTKKREEPKILAYRTFRVGFNADETRIYRAPSAF